MLPCCSLDTAVPEDVFRENLQPQGGLSHHLSTAWLKGLTGRDSAKGEVLCFSLPPFKSRKLCVAEASELLLEEVRMIIKFLPSPSLGDRNNLGLLVIEANTVIVCVTALLHPHVLTLPLKAKMQVISSLCCRAAAWCPPRARQ